MLDEVSMLVGETHPGRKIAVALDSDFERDLGLDSLARAETDAACRPGLRRHAAGRGAGRGAHATRTAALPRSPDDGCGPGEVRGAAGGSRWTPAFRCRRRPSREVLEWHAARHPERLHVLLYGDGEQAEEISYGALREEARRIASGLVARGLQPQQTVALMLPTSREYFASFFGVMLCGRRSGADLSAGARCRSSRTTCGATRASSTTRSARCWSRVPQAKTVARLLQRRGAERCATIADAARS
ncbi:MAG: long-chain fatty acid--CoA ligase [Chromatiales bacterium]|nr:long-chain fatty acid--CoA ligase [Chromatiales bacterium]